MKTAQVEIELLPMAQASSLLEESSRDFLSPREQERCGKFKSNKRRQDWLAGRWAVKRLFHRRSCRAGTPVPMDRIEVLNRDSGEPYVETPQPMNSNLPAVSISHCPRYALAAAAGPGLRVGADIEVIAARAPSWLELIAHPAEDSPALRGDPAAQTVLWSLKEAVVKALGTGLSVGFGDVRLIPDKGGSQVPVLGRVRLELHGKARDAWGNIGRPRISLESAIFDDCVLSVAHAPSSSQETNAHGKQRVHLD